jgi:hypothetical protein
MKILKLFWPFDMSLSITIRFKWALINGLFRRLNLLFKKKNEKYKVLHFFYCKIVLNSPLSYLV